AALPREYAVVLGLEMPERSQPQRLAAERAGIAQPRQDRRRALRERAERGPRLHVGVLQLAVHALDLVDDRREEQLGRLDRVEAVTEHERAQDGIDVLRVAAVTRERKPERARLLAQPADGVDLALVRERGEWLDAG